MDLLIFYLNELEFKSCMLNPRRLQMLAYNFYIYTDLAYRTWIVVHLDRRLKDPLSFNNNFSIFIYTWRWLYSRNM
jgi:hypothetical protein